MLLKSPSVLVCFKTPFNFFMICNPPNIKNNIHCYYNIKEIAMQFLADKRENVIFNNQSFSFAVVVRLLNIKAILINN